MKVTQSDYLSWNKELMKKLITLLSADFPYVSILSTDVSGTRYQAQKTETTVQDSSWCERGFVIRVYQGKAYSEFSFNRLPAHEIKAFAVEIKERLNRSLAILESMSLERNAYPLIKEEKIARSWAGEVEKLPDQFEPQQKIQKLQDIKDRALKWSREQATSKQKNFELIDLRVIYEEVKVAKLFLSTAREL